MRKKAEIPENVMALLSAADRKNGLPEGTMYSVVQQEVGGQLDKFLKDPGAAHYEKDASGKKKSSAFGILGILEPTATKPGYGVTPLKDKSLEEQIRFGAEYLAARAKQAGSLEKGLAGYGEGDKYAQQVLSRMGDKSIPAPVQDNPMKALATVDKADPYLALMNAKGNMAAPAPAPVVAQQEQVAPVQLADTGPSYQDMVAQERAKFMENFKAMSEEELWKQFNSQVAPIVQEPVQQPQVQMNTFAVPSFNVPVINTMPNFHTFGSWGKGKA